MKKLLIKVVSLLTVLTLIFCLAGCGNTESVTASTVVDHTSETTVESSTQEMSSEENSEETTTPVETTTVDATPSTTPTEAPTEDNGLDLEQQADLNDVMLAADWSEEEETPAATVEDAEPAEEEEENVSSSPRLYEPSDFKWMGVLNWNGWRWTYYSQRVLPGGGLNIPGRHVDNDGYVCDENDYICLASSSLSWGTIVDTPLGKQGRVYDSGCASDTLDVYCDW